MTLNTKLHTARNTLAFWLASLLGVIGVALIPAQANAEVNSKIVTTVDNFSVSTITGKPVPDWDGKLYRYQTVKLDVSYDATNADPQPGDSIVIQLPDTFRIGDSSSDLGVVTKPLMWGKIPAGECTIDPYTVTCTFNDTIVGKTDVKGTISVVMAADKVTTNTSSTFVLNGTDVVVPHPGNAPIGVAPWWPATPNKDVWALNSNSKHITWAFAFNGGLVDPYITDGSLTVVDTLGAGINLSSDLSRLSLRYQGQDMGDWQTIAWANGTDTGAGFTLESIPVPAAYPNATFALKINGPFRKDYNYQLVYSTPFDTGSVTPGMNYDNTLTLLNTATGENQSFTKTAAYIERFQATINMREGFGSFQVAKKITGAVPPAGTTFDVLVSWQLPDGKSAADYPGWTPPANPAVLSVPANQAVGFADLFPVGTKVTLTEDIAKANASAPDTYRWSGLTFSYTDDSGKAVTGEKATFTITNKTLPEIVLTNTAVQRSTFTVAKQVKGNDSLVGTTYTFKWVCGTESGELKVPANGNAVPVGKYFDEGTQCSVSEVAPEAVPNYSLTLPADQTFNIAAGVVNAVSFTNTYTVTAKPSIDIEKGDVAGNDADTDPVVLPSGSTEISFVVKNNGTEPLRDLTVSDALTSGSGTMSDLVCSYNGAEISFPWAGPLPVDAQITCKATLSGVTSVEHVDTASVTGTGVLSGTVVKDEDPYHAVRGSVAVGDLVWLDSNKDGLQSAGEPGIADVELTLTGPDGQPVVDIDGSPVAPVRTDASGKYVFEKLPVLADGQSYTVKVSNVPAGLVPTTAGVGGDRGADSSTDSAASTGLTANGQQDLTLDFGFVKQEVPTPTPTPEPTPAPEPTPVPTPTQPATPVVKITPGLPKTGGEGEGPAGLVAVLALASAAGVLLKAKHS